jgi:hypothetical protein
MRPQQDNVIHEENEMSNPSHTMTGRGGRSRLWDRVLLFGTGLLVCIAGVGSGILGEIYHVNSAWLFFAWNSILLIPLVGGDFRSQLKRPSFILFFFAWMIMHGLTVLGLMRWVDVLYWIPLLAVELFIGYFAAYCLFDIPSE